jgi:hypothetical protein
MMSVNEAAKVLGRDARTVRRYALMLGVKPVPLHGTAHPRLMFSDADIRHMKELQDGMRSRKGQKQPSFRKDTKNQQRISDQLKGRR